MSTSTAEQIKQTKTISSGNNFQIKEDINIFLKSVLKGAIQKLLEAELESELGYGKQKRSLKNTDNSRNGHNPKTVKSVLGKFEVEIPRDRKGKFVPKIIPKYQRNLGIEKGVISLYAKGMSTRNIGEQIQEIYGFRLSAATVSRITNRIAPEIKEWQQRPLEAVYPFIFINAIEYKVKHEAKISKHASYAVLGVTEEGKKDILGIWIKDNEPAMFWPCVMENLKNRGVQDVLLFCVDNIMDIKEPINSAFPMAEIQRCIIHQLRDSFKNVSRKDRKTLSEDFKSVYQAANEDTALEKLDELKGKWGKAYPSVFRSWKCNWDTINTFYKFPGEIRKIIYTTNMIEALYRYYRKVTKTKTMFPSVAALEKMLYLATKNVMKKYILQCKDWDLVLGQLKALYPERIRL